MEDKTKLHKGVGQIKEGMGKISEGVGNIVETKVDPKPAVKPSLPPSGFTQKAPPPAAWQAKDGPAPEVKAVEPVLPSKAAAFPGATFDVDQTPPPPVEKAAPPPKPVPNAPNVKKAEGITYIGKYKKFHAEFKTGGRTINVGLFDTEKEATKALNREKAEYNL